MKKIILTLFLLASFFVTPFAHAQLQTGVFDKFSKSTFGTTFQTGTNASLEKQLPAAVGQIITIFLSLIGVILLIIIVYAGFLWLTAGGNDDQIKKAKRLISNGVIGLAIALGAFVITSFVVQQVQQAVSTPVTETAE